MSQNLIAALQNPSLYPHEVDGFQVIETHISWVILTGQYAYKLKNRSTSVFSTSPTSINANTFAMKNCA